MVRAVLLDHGGVLFQPLLHPVEPRGQDEPKSAIEKFEQNRLSQMGTQNTFLAFSRKLLVLRTQGFYLTQPQMVLRPRSRVPRACAAVE